MDWRLWSLCTIQYFLHRCTAYDVAFVSTWNVIRYYNLTDSDGRGTYVPLTNTSLVAALDYDLYQGYIYWADVNLAIISRARLNGTDERIIHNNIGYCNSLAVDSKSGMMYWTDGQVEERFIRISYLNGSGKRELIQDFLGVPYSLTLDTKNGKIYWVVVGSNPLIERANLDGSKREVLLNDSTIKPLGLSLDLDNQRMYWSDMGTKKIMYSDLEGGNPTELMMTDFSYSTTVAVYGDTVFWSETGQGVPKILKHDKRLGDTPYEFLTMPEWDLYCLKTARTNDGKEIMLACEENGMREFDLTVERDLGRKIDALSNDRPIAIDYDVIDDKIYWIDRENRSVKVAYRNGSGIMKLADTALNVRAGLGIDFETDQLFWSDRPKKAIRNITLTGEDQNIYKASLTGVTTLALDSTNKYVYWIIYGRNDGKIERDSYNGGNMTTLLSGLQYPGAIVLDASIGLMYWNEYNVDTIGIADMEGTKIGSMPAKNKIRYMSILDDYIYWYSFNQHIGKINRETQSEGTTVLSGSEYEFTSMKIVQEISSCEDSDCVNGGTCESLGVGYMCHCAGGFTGRNCETEVDECVSVPCLNNGTCVDMINTYKCICVSGYIGDLCETDVDECQSNPCQNSGLCVDDINKYHCICRSGFIGDRCETGLGFLVVIAVGITLTAVIALLIRKASTQRRKKSSLSSQQKDKIFTLMHLPSPRHDQMYRLNDIILT